MGKTPSSPSYGGEVVYSGGVWSDKCKKKQHNATEPIYIGGFPVWLGKAWEIAMDTIDQMDFICPLNGDTPKNLKFGHWMLVLGSQLHDRGGVPSNWKEYIEFVAEEIRKGKKILAYCTGSHGRTGTFAASLIAVMEPETEDPIAAIRERHCEKAVESKEQATAVFKLRNQELPEHYKTEFTTVQVYSGYSSSRPTFIISEQAWPPVNTDTREIFMAAWRKCFFLRGWNAPTNLEYPGCVIFWIGNDKEDDLVVPLNEVGEVLEAMITRLTNPLQWKDLRAKFLRPATPKSSGTEEKSKQASQNDHLLLGDGEGYDYV